MVARYKFLKSGQASNKLLKSTVCAKSALALISLIALCACAIAQDNSADYLNNKADYWYKRGLNLTGSGSYEEALGSYDKAIQINPKYAGAWDGRASALRSLSLLKRDTNDYNESLQAYDKAIGLYDDAIKANPQDINALYYKGLALSNRALTMRAGQKLNMTVDEQEIERYFEEALGAYDKAIEINPEYVTAWKNKGNVLYNLGKYNESLQAYDRAIEIVPKYSLAWYNKGLALYKLGRFEEAVSAYDKAMETDPNDAAIWYNKGNAFLGQGNYDAAVECYDYAIKLNPSLAEAWYNKGLAFEKLGLDTGADAAFARAKDLGYEAES